jgi:hypothetical protein
MVHTLISAFLPFSGDKDFAEFQILKWEATRRFLWLAFLRARKDLLFAEPAGPCRNSR